MKKWKIILTQRAEDDLDEIYTYIAETLLEPEIAKKQRNRIANSIHQLAHFPERCPLHDAEPWRSQKLRFLTVDNYLAIYKVLDESDTVSVITVVYAKRNISELLG
jgi:toxin ParE1/3/4